MSTFTLSSERNEEALINKNSEDNRYVVLMILVVKNQLPLVLTLMVAVGAMDNLYYMISSSQFHHLVPVKCFNLLTKIRCRFDCVLGRSQGLVVCGLQRIHCDGLAVLSLRPNPLEGSILIIESVKEEN
jgi:hypothetical protein